MANSPKRSLTRFESEFLARTAQARNAIGYSQEKMARALGITQGKYKQYEIRTLLPHEYVERFCLITRRSINWLFTGSKEFPD